MGRLRPSATLHRPAIHAGLLATLTFGLLAPLGGPARADQSESPTFRVAAASLTGGTQHTCAITATGRVRCWGIGSNGRLGYGNLDTIGDNEPPSSAGYVALGGKATAIAAGETHTCALLTTRAVRCWGDGGFGKLGYGNNANIGDDESPASAGDVPLGGKAIAISAASFHTCALLATGAVRCWGNGHLGYGGVTTVGDDETPASAGNVTLGGKAVAVTTALYHTCALLASGAVRCWGDGADGKLGYGDTDTQSDAVSAGEVPLGGKTVAITAGQQHTCALLTTGAVRCWGVGTFGRLGYGLTATFGDTETPAEVGDVPLGKAAVAISAGDQHTCALLANRAVRCWGRADQGALGYGNATHVGDSETPASAGNVPIGGTAAAVTAGGQHTCASLAAGGVRCWGMGLDGQLGYGSTSSVGVDETPDTIGPVPVGAKVRTRAATNLTVRARPGRDRSAPYVFRLRGKVAGPFAVDRATCTGKVRLIIKKRSKTVASRHVGLSPTCTYVAKVRISSGKIGTPRKTTLKVRARLRPTDSLTGDRAATTVVAN